MRTLRLSHLTPTFCPSHSKRLLILLQVQSIWSFIQFAFFCVISCGSVQFLLESKAIVSPSHFSAAVSRPALPECGHLYDLFFSPAENREPLIYGSMPRLCLQGAPRVLQQIFLLSLLLFFLSHCDSHIFCSLIYYYRYCSSIDFTKVDFLQSIISVVCKGIHQCYSWLFLGSGISTNHNL